MILRRTFKKIFNKKVITVLIILAVIFAVIWFWPNKKREPNYGVSFSAEYARDELRLDPKQALEAIFSDLGVKKIRLVAYWNKIEKDEGKFDFSDLDWQIEMAKKYNAEVILALGRRVPRWPECHIPGWVFGLGREKEHDELKHYIRAVIERYRNSETIKMWQVENEPYLATYAYYFCGTEIRSDLLEDEIRLVHSLDFSRKVLLTDSGELGIWLPAYKRGDAFGSTFYMFVEHPIFGDFKNYFSSNFYNLKLKFAQMLYGEKPSYLIEVSLEPWAIKALRELSLEEQKERMNIDRANQIIDRASRTNFTEQYLWGAEWWYYMKEHGDPEFWNFTKKLFNKNDKI